MECRASYDSDVDNLKATELRLGLPGTDVSEPRGSKRALADQSGSLEINSGVTSHEAPPPVAKAQVVGWPPIRAYRRNSLQAKKTEVDGPGTYVKVSLDGAPYLRKMDLEVYKGYKELTKALEDKFKCFSLGNLSGMEGINESDYAVTYEDKDGDWMLVGDVPWGMFISSCKRLRIMKASEARGLGGSP